MNSLWSQTTDRPEFETLKSDIKTDVLIIGGGICGILCGYMLKSVGIDCVIAEADKICGGVTQNTTAKITLQHGLIYDKMISRFGEEYAALYMMSQQAALDKYREMCKKIDCDYKECDAYVYSLNDRKKIEKEVAAYNKLNYSAIFTDKLTIPVSVAGAVCVKNQAQFHSLKFLYTIAKDLNIYENTRVTELVPGGAATEHGNIFAERIVVATHFPFLNKHGMYFLKMYQHRSYVIGLENAPDVKGMYIDESGKGLSFRNYGDLLLLGGGSHRTGKKGGNWRELSEFAKKNYPNVKEKFRWATQDCMTLDDIPYIGRYSENTHALYVATGFNKWGMSSSMVAAMLLTDILQGKYSEYENVYSPSRSVLRPQLVLNIAESMAGLLRPTAPRCPHMYCALKYNPQEHTWDCSCHGSRFSESGELLNNPANADKK
ncbi:MAG: FAD-dependent oxidoreductase [Ruminococcaceae bacterium]|nr:FAD-dependent oxidoreductase [Oscillospiraceae bacterium]